MKKCQVPLTCSPPQMSPWPPTCGVTGWYENLHDVAHVGSSKGACWPGGEGVLEGALDAPLAATTINVINTPTIISMPRARTALKAAPAQRTGSVVALMGVLGFDLGNLELQRGCSGVRGGRAPARPADAKWNICKGPGGTCYLRHGFTRGDFDQQKRKNTYA